MGGPGSLVGLGALAVLVWWLVTRWDGRAQARVAPGRAPDADQPAHAVPRPAWYVGGGPRERAAEVTDPHGFRPEWIDPATGTWRDHVHSRERRAAARLAEEAPRAATAPTGSGSAATAAKPRLGPIAQAATYAGAVLAALAALGISLLLGVGPTPTLLAAVSYTHLTLPTNREV